MKLFAKNGADKKDNSLNLFHAEAGAASSGERRMFFSSQSLIRSRRRWATTGLSA